MAAAPDSRALRPRLQPGDLLAGRYRLDRRVPSALDDAVAELWRATDEVLDRPVAAKLLPAGGRQGDEAARPFLAAAAASGAVAHPVLARVYDAATESRAGGHAGQVEVAYVISEWVEGPDLAAALAEDGPWQSTPAVVLAERLADALAVAHDAGLLHGRLHPGNVLLTLDGGVKLTDLAVAAALPGRTPVTTAQEDLRDVAALLYAALTARWPVTGTPQPSAGLPPAPAGRDGTDGVRLASPAQVRAGVPRALDSVVMRALDPQRAGTPPALTSALGLAAVLAGVAPVEQSGVPAGPRPPRIPGEVRRWLPAAVVVALLVLLGTASYSLGISVGSVAPLRDRLETLASPQPGTSAAPPGAVLPLAEATVTDFDPPPGDGRERPGSLSNAYDGDPSTVWETERYDSAAFGGLKPGVGLLVDLGRSTPVGKVELAVEAPDTAFELRVADSASADLSDYRVVASGRSAGEGLVLSPTAGTSGRYYLLWITSLPQVDGRFVAGIAELRFSRP